jgi:hypothetical protein
MDGMAGCGGAGIFASRSVFETFGRKEHAFCSRNMRHGKKGSDGLPCGGLGRMLEA